MALALRLTTPVEARYYYIDRSGDKESIPRVHASLADGSLMLEYLLATGHRPSRVLHFAPRSDL